MADKNVVNQTPPPTPPGYYQDSDLPMPVDPDRNIYNSSFLGIFSRNFVAGFSRALGSIFVYLFFFALVFYLFSQYVLPEFRPLLDTFEQLGRMQSEGQQLDISAEDMQNLLEEMRN